MLITIDYKDRRPIYQQLMDRIEELAMQGLIQPDEQLPSVRSLAVELAINPNTISRAYGELEKKGVTYSVPGRGSFLAAGRDVMQAAAREQIRRELARIIERAGSCGIGRSDFLAEAAAIYDARSQNLGEDLGGNLGRNLGGSLDSEMVCDGERGVMK